MTSLPSLPSARTMRGAAALLLAGVLPSGTVAQVLPASPAKTVSQDEAVVLSPFVISTGRDSGFVAASSLAGGRLAGDLKDTPVAY